MGNVTSLKEATVGAAMKTTRGAKSAVRNTLSAYNQRGFIMHMKTNGRSGSLRVLNTKGLTEVKPRGLLQGT